MFATTAFDRGTDAFNVLLSWPVDRPQDATVLGSTADKPNASLELRQGIAAALPNAPFFKIEGIAATSDQLLLGVREVGPDFKSAQYTVTILSVGYRVTDSGVELQGTPKQVWQMDKKQSQGLPKGPIGLGDLAFDPASQSVLLATSYEDARSSTPESVAGYLWRLNAASLGSDAPAELVRTGSGEPLMFTHKAEGVLPIAGKVVVLHDDDKRATTVHTQGVDRVKQPNEAAFDIVTVR